MARLRIRSKHRYAPEDMILSAHSSGLWFDRRSLTSRLPQTYGIIHISPQKARALAHWILKQYPEE